jgi:diaminopimelate decarboxylase
MSEHRTVSDWSHKKLLSLVEKYGTPLYVVDLDRIRQNYQRLSSAFEGADIYYAAKANTSGAILQTLENLGAGIECVSAGELYRSMRSNLTPERLIYTAVNPPDPDLDFAVGLSGLTINIGSHDTLRRLSERDYCGRICLRINTGSGAGHHKYVSTGSDAKFGFSPDQALDLLSSHSSHDFDIVGIHAHAGSGISPQEMDVHQSLCKTLGDISRSSPINLEFIDVGGGFGVPDRPEDLPLDLFKVSLEIQKSLGKISAKLVLEPGRYIVADAGILLTKINTIKNLDSHTMVGVDAGMHTLLRPALYGSYHDIQNISSTKTDPSLPNTIVTGPICESADILGVNIELEASAPDDILAIGNAGAYGEAMESQYNSFPRSATVAIDRDNIGLIRKRETLEDLCSHEHEADWL